jgi:hypothetical protein
LESPSIQSLQQLESPLGAAQTLGNTRNTKLRWIEEWIGIVALLKLTMVQPQQLTGEK